MNEIIDVVNSKLPEINKLTKWCIDERRRREGNNAWAFDACEDDIIQAVTTTIFEMVRDQTEPFQSLESACAALRLADGDYRLKNLISNKIRRIQRSDRKEKNNIQQLKDELHAKLNSGQALDFDGASQSSFSNEQAQSILDAIRDELPEELRSSVKQCVSYYERSRKMTPKERKQQQRRIEAIRKAVCRMLIFLLPVVSVLASSANAMAHQNRTPGPVQVQR